MILTFPEEIFQNHEAGGVIIDGEYTHSDRKLFAGITRSLLHSHFLLQTSQIPLLCLWVRNQTPERSYETEEAGKTIEKKIENWWGINSNCEDNVNE